MTTALPPGPTASAAQQTLQWIAKPYAFLRACHDEYGDTFSLDFGPQGKWVLFSHPDAIRTIFTGDPRVLHAGKGHVVLRGFLGPGSLLQLDAESHLRERKLLLPAFHGTRMLGYSSLIRDIAREATESWAPGQRVVIHDVMQRVSLRVMLHAVFGLRNGALAEELEQRLLSFLGDPKFNLAFLGRMEKDLSESSVWQAYWKSFERIDELVLERVGARRHAGTRDEGDVLSMLLYARDEQGKGLSDRDLRDELVTLLVTGYETTATSLAWAFHWLHQHRPPLDRLRAELQSSDAERAPEACASLPYLDAVCRETLRLSPVIPLVARQLQSAFQVEQWAIPEGTTIAACIYLAHHRPETYVDPQNFRPERFLDRQYSPYEWLPFGGGARRCLAMPLALLEMKVVLATLLMAWELDAADSDQVLPLRRSVSVGPSGGTPVVVRARRSETTS